MKTKQELIRDQRIARANLRGALKDAETFAEILALLAVQIALTPPAPRKVTK